MYELAIVEQQGRKCVSASGLANSFLPDLQISLSLWVDCFVMFHQNVCKSFSVGRKACLRGYAYSRTSVSKSSVSEDTEALLDTVAFYVGDLRIFRQEYPLEGLGDNPFWIHREDCTSLGKNQIKRAVKCSRYPLSQPGGTVERGDGLGERQDNCPALQMNYVLETHVVEPESQSLGVNGQGHCCLPVCPAHVLTQGHYAAQEPSSGCRGVDGGHRSAKSFQIMPRWSWAPSCPTSQ